MNLTEKAAYLQGLAEGMDLGDSKESRLIRELISMVSEMATYINDVDETVMELGDELDELYDAIAELEGLETLTDEEYNAEIQYWVDYYQGYMTKDEIIANMGEAVIREGALSAKVQKWLLERVTFTYTDAE